MVLTNIFEEVIKPDFHYLIRGQSTKGFGTTAPIDILANLQYILYGKLIYQELDVAMLRLNYPMNRVQTVKVMLRGITEVKIFLLFNPDKDRALTEPNLISYALIKLTKPGGMYAKGIKNCQKGRRRIGKNGPNSRPIFPILRWPFLTILDAFGVHSPGFC